MREVHARLCTSGGNLCTFLFAVVFFLRLLGSPATHACEAEVASACPERPGSEIAGCLKDKEQHENPTELSSECTDLIALHTACAEEIDNLCDGAYFTDDTILCLTQWVSETQLSERCAGVISWAVPKDEEDGDGPTDELGMSDKDREEKEEWRKKRRAARGDAIERMKMKEVDKKKEEDRVALEKYKEENPEEYAAMIQQQEEEAKQQAEQKRRERQLQAAFERKKRLAAGITDEEEDQPSQPNKKRKQQQPAPTPTYQAGGNSTLMAGGALLFIGVVCVGGYLAVKYLDDQGKKSKEKPSKKSKKGK